MKRLMHHCPYIIIASVMCLLFSSCCDVPPAINYFAFEEFSPTILGIIDHSEHTIEVTLPDTVDVTRLSPTVKVFDPECHSFTPTSRSIMDFSNPVIYEVTNEKGVSVFYEVTVFQTRPVNPDSVHISWREGSEIPKALACAASSVVNNKVYVSGGVTSDGKVRNSMHIYDPLRDEWITSDNTLKEDRWGHTSSVVDGKIYVMGGSNFTTGPALNTIEVYDPGSGTWSVHGEMTKGRIGHGAVSYNGKIYVIGGEYEEPSLTLLRTMEVYDPANDVWESLSSVSVPRIFMAVCLVDDTIYVLGGGSRYPYEGVRSYVPGGESKYPCEGLRSIEAYIIAEDRWEKKTDLKVGLADLRACVIKGHIFSAGGSVMWTAPAQAIVQVYDPVSNTVTLADDMQTTRTGHLMETSQGHIMVMGGMQQWKSELLCTSNTEIGIPEF